MRKVLAAIVSIITIFAIREGFNIYTSTEKDVIGQKPILLVIALSIILPLLLLSFWLWKPKAKNSDQL